MEFRSHVKTIESLRGPAGHLEALLNTGRDYAEFAAVVAHPHPLFGGTMHNKVVYHAAKAFSSFGLPVLRFNFRGAGLSEGTHDEGNGEVDDVRAAVDWMVARFALPVVFAGFSFGSYVGLRACCGDPRVRGLAALGLPVRPAGRVYTYEFLRGCGGVPKLFLTGDHDEFSPRDVLESVVESVEEPKKMVWIEGADHFFQGALSVTAMAAGQSPDSKLDVMSAALRRWLAEEFELRTEFIA